MDAALKKVSDTITGIVCIGVIGLCDASVIALAGLTTIDLVLVWLFLADVSTQLKKAQYYRPQPTADFPKFYQIFAPTKVY